MVFDNYICVTVWPEIKLFQIEILFVSNNEVVLDLEADWTGYMGYIYQFSVCFVETNFDGATYFAYLCAS